MSRMGDAVTARVRLALGVMVGAAVSLLMPWLMAATADAPSLVVLTAMAVAAFAGLHARAAVRAATVRVPPRPPAEAAGGVLLAGRVTDTPHHPLRPRAPGVV